MRGIVFSAAGTAGQRCTTMRRVIAHRSRRRRAHRAARLGVRPAADRQPDGRRHPGRPADPPRARTTACRPPIAQAAEEGGKVVAGGGRALEDQAPDAYYVQPAIVRMRRADRRSSRTETFAPLLYVLPYDEFDEAIALNNAVPQGLSSSVFTTDQAEAELFLSAEGSDCGIVNVNIGTSGRRDRRRLRRREGDRRRARVRLRRVAGLHAPGDQHGQLLRRAPAGPGRRLHRLGSHAQRRRAGRDDLVLLQQHGVRGGAERDEASPRS